MASAGARRQALRWAAHVVAGAALAFGVVLAFAPFERPFDEPYSRGVAIGRIVGTSECGAPLANAFRDDPKPEDILILPGAPFTRIRANGVGCEAPSRRRAVAGVALVGFGAVALTVLLTGRARHRAAREGLGDVPAVAS